jgi:ferredoxin-like protein FixX
MATHKAKCDKCNYRAEFFAPLRSYEMADGSTVTIEHTFVWCAACRAVRCGEQLANIEELERELTAIEARAPSILEEFSVLVDRHTSLEQVLASRAAELRARIAWRRIRISPARCLECGSAGILALQHSETRSGNDKWTLAEHVGCGGVVTVLQELTLTLDRRWIRYSPEGERRQAYEMYAHKGAVPIDTD